MKARGTTPQQKHGGPLARAREPVAELLAPWNRQKLSLFSRSPFRIYFHGGWANGGEGGRIRRGPISVMIRYERTALIV